MEDVPRKDGWTKFHKGKNGPSRKGQKRRQSRRKSMKGGQRGE